MAHYIFRYLVNDEHHEVVVLLDFNSYLGTIKESYEFEGVEVVSDKDRDLYYRSADAIFTHLDKTGKAYNYARRYGKPLFHFIHNNYKNVVVENQNAIDQFAIYNSEWVREKVKDIQRSIVRSVVVHPPVFLDDYSNDRINSYITLINLNKNKGGELFMELAKNLPEYQFMGVMGSYGEQFFDHKLKNVHYIPHTGDINYVYRRTRILLMPSAYESYGRTALEASCSRIPVICTPTPGLKEAMSTAAIYVERDDVDGWIQAIRKLDNEEYYAEASEKCYLRAKSLEPGKELEYLNKFICYEIQNNENAR